MVDLPSCLDASCIAALGRGLVLGFVVATPDLGLTAICVSRLGDRGNRLWLCSGLGDRGTRLWLSGGLGVHGTRLGLSTWFGVRGRTLGLSTRLAANCTSLRFRRARLGFHSTLLGFCLHEGYDGHKDGHCHHPSRTLKYSLGPQLGGVNAAHYGHKQADDSEALMPDDPIRECRRIKLATE